MNKKEVFLKLDKCEEQLYDSIAILKELNDCIDNETLSSLKTADSNEREKILMRLSWITTSLKSLQNIVWDLDTVVEDLWNKETSPYLQRTGREQCQE